MISFIKNKSNALRSKDRKKLMVSVFMGTNFYSINKDRTLVFKSHCQETVVFLKKSRELSCKTNPFLYNKNKLGLPKK